MVDIKRWDFDIDFTGYDGEYDRGDWVKWDDVSGLTELIAFMETDTAFLRDQYRAELKRANGLEDELATRDARIAELEADNAFRRRYSDHLDAESEALAKLHSLAVDERDALRADLALMRPVVEAAVEWSSAYSSASAEHRMTYARVGLGSSVRAYEAAVAARDGGEVGCE